MNYYVGVCYADKCARSCLHTDNMHVCMRVCARLFAHMLRIICMHVYVVCMYVNACWVMLCRYVLVMYASVVAKVLFENNMHACVCSCEMRAGVLMRDMCAGFV